MAQPTEKIADSLTIEQDPSESKVDAGSAKGLSEVRKAQKKERKAMSTENKAKAGSKGARRNDNPSRLYSHGEPHGNRKLMQPLGMNGGMAPVMFNSPRSLLNTAAVMAACYKPPYTEDVAQSQPLCVSGGKSRVETPSQRVARVWNGELLPRTYNNPAFSSKVFIGGIPWDITEETLIEELGKYGNCRVEWPFKGRREDRSALRTKATGYVYVVFDKEASVKKLLQECSDELGAAGECFFPLRSRRYQSAEVRQVQVIPWVVSDVIYSLRSASAPQSKLTVFVGALHGMLTAQVLFSIMSDVFGHVESVEIDADKHKYPIGSGRVGFSSEKSYLQAIEAGFLEIKTSKFTKRIQIDPYLVDSRCSQCDSVQGPYFCRERSCFRYFCLPCWQMCHPNMGRYGDHKPLVRKPRYLSRTEDCSRDWLMMRNNTRALMYAYSAYQPAMYSANGMAIGYLACQSPGAGYLANSRSKRALPTYRSAWVVPQYRFVTQNGGLVPRTTTNKVGIKQRPHSLSVASSGHDTSTSAQHWCLPGSDNEKGDSQVGSSNTSPGSL